MRAYAKTPTVFQMESTECGAACLAMVLGYYGRDVPLEQMRIETGVSRDGSKAGNLVRAAGKFGLKAKGYRYSLEGLLDSAVVPCIIHWNFNHFVVFEGKRGDFYCVNDPAGGRRRLIREELDEGYTGITLQFEKGEDFVKERQNRSILDFVKIRFRGQLHPVLSLLGIGLLLVVPGLMMPVLAKVFIDDILIGRTTGWVTQFLVIMVGTVLFQMFFTYLREALLLRFQNKLAMVSAHNFIFHMFRLPMAFFDQRSAGDLAGRVENNNSVSVFLAGELAETILNIFVSLFYLVLLLAFSVWLTVIGICVSLVNFGLMKFSSVRLSDMSRKMRQDLGKMQGVFYTGVSVIDSLKASGVENSYVGKILGYYTKTAVKGQEMERTQEVLNAVPEMSKNITSVLVLMYGGVLVIRGSMTAGQLVAYAGLLASFVAPVNSLMGFIRKIQTAKTDMARVEDILKYREDALFDEGSKRENMETKLSGLVELDRVSFGYSILERPLVEDFSFRLPVGSSIAFVGASGSGKSTVAKIISGLYQPWDGEIRVDGIPMKEIPADVIHASVSTVSQNIILFAGTIRENLTMWNKYIMETDMIKAAKDACIHDIITQKPGAYDYMLAEGGANLSGGQRQRLEIARALVTNPTILVMDEATSALDPLVEKEIMDNIKRRGCTCITVAHRLSAVRDCDEIIVMDRGKIVQRGIHEELMREEGFYIRLIQTI